MCTTGIVFIRARTDYICQIAGGLIFSGTPLYSVKKDTPRAIIFQDNLNTPFRIRQISNYTCLFSSDREPIFPLFSTMLKFIYTSFYNRVKLVEITLVLCEKDTWIHKIQELHRSIWDLFLSQKTDKKKVCIYIFYKVFTKALEMALQRAKS